MSRHDRDLKVGAIPSPPLMKNPLAVEKQSVAAEDNELPLIISIPRRAPEESDNQHPDDDDGPGRPLPGRGSRERRPTRFQYYDLI